jgi:hypothetical protein
VFLLTVAQRIKFVVTAEHVPVRTPLSLSKHMKRVLEVYGRAQRPHFTMQALTLMKPFGGPIWATHRTDQQ